jgi:DNA-binding response OmpR family regulator
MTLSTARILIVDDELSNRESLEHLLQTEGYTTLTADSGKKALLLVLDRAPDLMLLDVTMPDIDGYSVASMVKANPATANIPIIMVSANSGRGARVVGLNSGAEAYLTKPVDPAELALKVRNLLRLAAA